MPDFDCFAHSLAILFHTGIIVHTKTKEKGCEDEGREFSQSIPRNILLLLFIGKTSMRLSLAVLIQFKEGRGEVFVYLRIKHHLGLVEISCILRPLIFRNKNWGDPGCIRKVDI
jgi:hypothetical protein